MSMEWGMGNSTHIARTDRKGQIGPPAAGFQGAQEQKGSRIRLLSKQKDLFTAGKKKTEIHGTPRERGKELDSISSTCMGSQKKQFKEDCPREKTGKDSPSPEFEKNSKAKKKSTRRAAA